MRIGHGYDVHRLSQGRRLILGGVDIPYERGLLGHSDADVLCHAISDAMLGALCLGDIGKHFPDNDPQFKDANSLELLGHIGKMILKQGYVIGNIDSTLIAQKPKIAPYIYEMRLNISGILGCSINSVGVKATTEEGLGFTGVEDGMACHAVCLLIKRNASPEILPL